MRIHVIAPNGVVTFHQTGAAPPREWLQEQVGGDVEYVRVLFKDGESTMIVNESGGVQNPPLSVNARATAIYWTATILGRTGVKFDPLIEPLIHGTAVLIEGVRKNDL